MKDREVTFLNIFCLQINLNVNEVEQISCHCRLLTITLHSYELIFFVKLNTKYIILYVTLLTSSKLTLKKNCVGQHHPKTDGAFSLLQCGTNSFETVLISILHSLVSDHSHINGIIRFLLLSTRSRGEREGGHIIDEVRFFFFSFLEAPFLCSTTPSPP